MGDDRLKRLRRLGVVKGARNLKPASPDQDEVRRIIVPTSAAETAGEESENLRLEVLLSGGRLVETEFGSCFVLDHVYPLSHRHGHNRLAELLALPTDAAATFCQDERLATLSVEDFVFLDTETTGLRGAGTIAFLVGAAYFDRDRSGHQAFIVRQYFLRDHGDESAMLYLLSELLEKRTGLVTFNGRSFDLPLLDTRYLMNRLDGMVGDLLERPHIDLLPPSRRLWRRRLGSCSLGSLEQNLLGLQRSQEDVPGWAIPALYLDYLRSGDARELLRVFYHNRIDMLSMVTLAGRIIRQFSKPQPDDFPLDLLSLARWQNALGLNDTAEEYLRMAVAQDLPLELYQQALHQLSSILKRNGRRDEAVQLWQQLAVTSIDDVDAHVELAKHFEWWQQDLDTARQWTRAALALAETWQTANTVIVQDKLQHRLTRLERKIATGQKG